MKKYELLKDDFKTLPDGRKLYRIRALVDVRPSVPAGTLGGYIESGLNLSQAGTAWVYDEAMVYDEACVLNDASVCDSAQIYGQAILKNNAMAQECAEIFGSAMLFGNSAVSGAAAVYGEARLFSNALVGGGAMVYEKAFISGDAQVYGDVEIYGSAKIYDEAEVFEKVKVHGHAIIKGLTRVFGLSEIYGDAELYAPSKICNAKIKNTNDYQVFYNVGSECGILTTYKTISGEIGINRGCFFGTLEEFEQAVKRRHGDSKYGRHYAAIIESIKIWFDLDKKDSKNDE